MKSFDFLGTPFKQAASDEVKNEEPKETKQRKPAKKEKELPVKHASKATTAAIDAAMYGRCTMLHLFA